MDKELEELLKKDTLRLKDESKEAYKKRMLGKALACNRWLPRFDPRIPGFGAWDGLEVSDDTARLINATCTYFNVLAFHDPPEYKDPSDTLSDEKWP
ncbi:MAG: hypothetical protein IJV69_06550 [Kiritimatiellae bacterium]|nr:hypothetical protein [Kiritimatiellia bacterium]